MIDKLVYDYNFTKVYLVFTTLVTGDYKPTDNVWEPHIVDCTSLTELGDFYGESKF